MCCIKTIREVYFGDVSRKYLFRESIFFAEVSFSENFFLGIFFFGGFFFVEVFFVEVLVGEVFFFAEVLVGVFFFVEVSGKFFIFRYGHIPLCAVQPSCNVPGDLEHISRK